MSCGHTNYGFRAVIAKCPDKNPRISRNDLLCQTCIVETDPKIGQRIQIGLHWTVVKVSVREGYPEVLHISQAAKNVFGRVPRQSSQIHGLNQVWRLAVQMKKVKESAH